VAVFSGDFAPGQIYAERFYLVAEVLSDSDSEALMEAKLSFYKGHLANLCVLIIAQERMHVVVHERSGEAGWSTREVDRPEAELFAPVIGRICRLSDLYKGTPLLRA
jgi:Uma2 family endonuclease